MKIDFAHGEESFYNPMLAGVVEDMLAKKIAFGKGAVVIQIPRAPFLRTKRSKERKNHRPSFASGMGHLHTRRPIWLPSSIAETWKPSTMLYVVGTPQALHFKTLFAQAQRWGYEKIAFQHIQFGSMLGKDRKMFATRKGGVIELMTLLDEAAKLGLEKYEANSTERRGFGHDVPTLSDEEKREIAERVGTGAVKYADLCQNRTTDYVFDYDKMLATDGNTATYMQYAYARCRAIFRKGEVDETRFLAKGHQRWSWSCRRAGSCTTTPSLPEAIEAAVTDYLPHLITAYLWDLAKCFSGFFEACQVLSRPIRPS